MGKLAAASGSGERRRISVLTHIFPSRSETFVRNHVLGLAQRNYSVTVISRQCGSDMRPEEIAGLDRAGVHRLYTGGRSSRLGFLKKSAVALFRKPSVHEKMLNPAPWSRRQWVGVQDTIRLVNSLAPDLVHVHFGTIAARLVALINDAGRQVPMVVTWHGYDANAVPKKRGSGVYKQLFDSNAQHTVGSEFVGSVLLALGAKPENLSVVPMGVDPAFFTYRSRKMIQGAALRVLSVGRLDDMKDHGTLIEAIGLLKSQGIPVELRIIGEGSLRSRLTKQIASASLEAQVHLLGARTSAEIVQEMHDAHVFALAGRITEGGKVESQGVVFAEAQATGLPVVACDVGGVSGSLVHGETGLLCPAGDVPAIAAAIAGFWKNPGLIDEFGRRGRQLVETRFSLDAMFAGFERVYDRAARVPSRIG
ncbi:MAG: glycosyltransferase [Gammaproteobacteria bacterium]|jgi:colanic acid/amylovoran biosynthesis glycosyltransferase|nr:glycosyltransferase [Gammaproteobacteria bacterium]